MKSFKYLLSMLLLSVAGSSFAACPQNLSAERMVDCIVSEAAAEVQDDFQWDSVASVESSTESNDASHSERALTFVAYDDES